MKKEKQQKPPPLFLGWELGWRGGGGGLIYRTRSGSLTLGPLCDLCRLSTGPPGTCSQGKATGHLKSGGRLQLGRILDLPHQAIPFYIFKATKYKKKARQYRLKFRSAQHVLMADRQFTARVTWTFRHWTLKSTELFIKGAVGRIQPAWLQEKHILPRS